MRSRILATLAATVLIAGAGQAALAEEQGLAPDSTPDTCDLHRSGYHIERGRSMSRAGWAEKKWRDRTPVRAGQRDVIRHSIHCLELRKDQKAIGRTWAKQRHQFKEWRGYRLAAPTDCGLAYRPEFYFTGGAVSCGTIDCESDGNWRIVNGIGAGGAYQIIPSTWRAYGGLEFAPTAAEATPREQSIIAARIAADGDQWDC